VTHLDDLLKELAAHDAVIEQNNGLNVDDQQSLAYALQCRARCLAELGRLEEAIGQWAALRQRFGASADAGLRAAAAAASVATGWELHHAGRWAEALVAYDDALALANDRDEPALQVQAVAALYRKALALSALEFSSDAVRAVAEVINDFGDDPPPEALPDVADAMLVFVMLMCRLGQEEDAIPAYDRLIARLENEDDESVHAAVARARIGRAALLGRHGQIDEAIDACDRVLADLGEAPEGLMVSIRALALAERGTWLQAAGRRDEAIASYQTLLLEFSDGQDPEIDEALLRAREAGAT
jgi:tetratricopeptide (TPR) repeat protein